MNLKNSDFYKKLKQIKKPVKEKSVVRKDRTKQVAIIIWTMITGIFLLSFLTVYLSLNTRSALNITNNELRDLEKEEGTENIPKGEAQIFVSDFISEFINIKSDSEYLDTRANNLKLYMAFNSKFQDESNPIYYPKGFDGERILKSQKLFGIDDKKNIYKYKVEYESKVTKEIEKEVTTGKGKKKKTKVVTDHEEEVKQHHLLLNVPIVYKEGEFSVKSMPYFEVIPDLKGNIEVADNKIELDEYEGNEKEDIEKFINSFFEKYTSESVEDLAYLMENPQSISGALELDNLTDLKIYYKDEEFIVTLTLTLVDGLTGINQTENIKLVISKNGKNYYVNKFEHI